MILGVFAMDLYVHVEGGEAVDIVNVEGGDTVAVLLSADDELLWLEDTDVPLAAAATFAEVGLVDRAHVHRGRRRRIATTVRFNGQSKEREFPPGTTVERVFRWAVGDHGFDLPHDQRATHTLGVTGTDVEADRDAHVGSLATSGAVSFDLAPKARYAG
jgi:hypothetical protein